MHIESVHIDGFKSYATRVDIDGFDRFFALARCFGKEEGKIGR